MCLLSIIFMELDRFTRFASESRGSGKLYRRPGHPRHFPAGC